MPAPFTVFTGTDTTTLTNEILAPGSGIAVDPNSIVLKASGEVAVNFYDGSLNLGIGAGLLLTSGTTPDTVNDIGWFGQDNSWAYSKPFFNGDADIDAVVNTVFQTQSYDATTLSFDFTVSDPAATSVSFDLVFGTDEYPEWVDQFVDCAIVMVNGVNYALFNHDPLHPLSVVSSNLAAGYFQDNAGGAFSIEYDGVSNVLKIVAPIIPGGATNHIKIGIADTGDHIYDSGIFIANLTAGNIPGSGVVIPGDSCTDNSDTVTGTSKDEYFDLKGGDDACYAGAGDDIVVAGGGNDSVYGGSGSDEVMGDSGDDSLDGGDGDDTAVYAGASSGYILAYDAASGSYTMTDNDLADGSEGTDTLASFTYAKFSDGLFTLAPGGLTPVSNPAPIPTNSAGLVLISGIAAEGNTLTATVSDADGISGAVNYQWQLSTNNGLTWSNVGTNTNSYTVSAADVGNDIKVIASYTDNDSIAESPVSAPITIQETNTGDLVVTLMQLTAPAGASTINPLTTLVQDAIDLGMSPNTAALAVKTVLGLPAGINLQTYDAYAVLLNSPSDPTAIAVEEVAVQVAILSSLSDDDTGMKLTLAILDAAANGLALDLANLNDLSGILGVSPIVDPVTGKYPQPLDEIYDRNKSMSDAIDDVLAGGGPVGATGLSVIETEWQDLLSIQANIDSTSIADLTIHVNQAPTGSATASLANGSENAAYTVHASDLLLGFSDADGGTLQVAGLTADSGALQANLDGTWTYTPDANFSGPVELTYSVEDGQGGSTPASQLLVIAPNAPVNHAPTGAATALLAAGSEDVAYVVSASDLLAGFSDADGDALSVTGLTATDGSVAANLNGTFTITPTPNFNGTVDLTYAVSDGNGGSIGATQSYALVAVNDAPTGGVTIIGTPTLGQTLTASNSLADVDGMGSVGYQWLADAVEIAGATNNTLLLGDAQVGKVISVRASYTDGFNTAESATSAVTSPVLATSGGTVTGSAGADVLNGGTGDDVLSGLGGNDTLNGGSGNDTLDGGAGRDRLNGDAGIDTASYAGSASGVTVSLQTNSGSGGHAQGDQLSGMENVIGSAFNDTLVGNAGANELAGGSGNDVLRGLGGTDALRGGLGADTFDFDAIADSGLSASADVILDFGFGSDRIDLSTIDANSLVKKDQAFTFIGGDALTGAGQLRFQYDSAGMTVIQGSTDADAAAEFEIYLVGSIDLTAAHFVL